MSRPRLDSRLLTKLSARTRKPEKYVREQISKRARRHKMEAEAAQILWCIDLGIGYSSFFRQQPQHIKDQVRSVSQPSSPKHPPRVFGLRKKAPKKNSAREERETIDAAINYLLTDKELRGRCRDLLKASGHFDRAFREATTVFDHRLKALSKIRKMNPLNLVGKTLNPDPQKAVIVVSPDNSEQEGFHSICKGLILAFRDTTHHQLSDKFSRQDALKFCGFVDTILSILSQSKICHNRI